MIVNKGKVLYFGAANKSLDFYTQTGYPCPEEKNPLDFYIDLAIKSGEDVN